MINAKSLLTTFIPHLLAHQGRREQRPSLQPTPRLSQRLTQPLAQPTPSNRGVSFSINAKQGAAPDDQPGAPPLRATKTHKAPQVAQQALPKSGSSTFAEGLKNAMKTGAQMPATALLDFLETVIEARVKKSNDQSQVEIKIDQDTWIDLATFTNCFNLSEFVASEYMTQQYAKTFSPHAKKIGDYVFSAEMKYQNQDFWRRRLGPPRKILKEADKIAIEKGLLNEAHEFKNIDLTHGHMFGNAEWAALLPDLEKFQDLAALEEYTGHDSAVMNPFFRLNQATTPADKIARLADPFQVKLALLKAVMVNSGINTIKALNLLNQFSLRESGTLANGQTIAPEDVPKNTLQQESDLFSAQHPLTEKSGQLCLPPFVSASDSFLVAKRFMGDEKKMYRLINDQSQIAVFPVSRMPSEREYILQQGANYHVRDVPTDWAKDFNSVYPEIPLVEIEVQHKTQRPNIGSLDLKSQYAARPWLIERMCDLASHFDRQDLLTAIKKEVPLLGSGVKLN